MIPGAGEVRAGGAPKGVVHAIERLIFIAAAIATICAFALQVLREISDRRRRREDPEKKNSDDVVTKE